MHKNRLDFHLLLALDQLDTAPPLLGFHDGRCNHRRLHPRTMPGSNRSTVIESPNIFLGEQLPLESFAPWTCRLQAFNLNISSGIYIYMHTVYIYIYAYIYIHSIHTHKFPASSRHSLNCKVDPSSIRRFPMPGDLLGQVRRHLREPRLVPGAP